MVVSWIAFEVKTGKSATTLTLRDLDASFVLAFLDHLEKERGNSVRTRNVRLVALRSFLHYAALRDPSALPTIEGVLAIPIKRFNRPQLGFLSREEIEAILAAPDGSTWSGHRDQVMLATFYNTGARVSDPAGALATGRAALPEPRWNDSLTLRRGEEASGSGRDRSRTMPQPAATSHLTSHSSTHNGDAPPTVGRGHYRYRSVVGA